MKKIYAILAAALVFSSCSKEKGYGPFNLKDGQEVELQINHAYGAIGDTPLLLPENESPELPLTGFDERQAGYSYTIRAKMVEYDGPVMMDGFQGSHLEFKKVVSKEKYQGDESFEISLVRSVVPGPDMIWLDKQEGSYYHILSTGAKIQLNYSDSQIAEKLEEIWNERIAHLHADSPEQAKPLKWKRIILTAKHDRQNFGQAYLVTSIELSE